MEFFEPYTKYILFNFFSFGTLLVTIFTFAFAYFFLTLPNKSDSTFHLGIGFFFLAIFNTGYFFAAFCYHPIAAYHRWLTGGFILPALLHLGQFFFKYPRDTNPKLSSRVLKAMWAVAIIVDIIFIAGTWNADRKFHFTGHYWDFDAEPISRMLAALIAIYSIISFVLIGGWKIYIIKTKERWVLLKILFAMLVAAITPNITNIMSRDGVMERSTYLIALTLFLVIGFFIISIVYVNSTKDRTTFMVKIVGLTLVTLLIILQASSFYSMKDKDRDYDSLRFENVSRILEGGDKSKDTKYFIQLSLDELEIQKKDYPSSTNLDLPLVEVDFRNTVIYEDIKNLPESNFRSALNEYLFNTHPYFEGFKNSIGEYLVKNKDLTDIELKEVIFPFLDKLNNFSFVHSNKISQLDSNQFCPAITKYLSSSSLKNFRIAIEKNFSNCQWNGRPIDSVNLRREINKYFRYFQAANTRHFRKSADEFGNQKHYIAYTHYEVYTQVVSEVGYSYLAYRQYMHTTSSNQQFILIIVVCIVIGIYPLFFRGSLVTPLWDLVHALEKVNHGDLEVEVPIKVNDEIGFLSDSFNSMVISIKYARSELVHYADNLEEKVNERTKEVQEKMDEVQKLKVQQDGDYFLTSLLTKPLFMNANKSEFTKTEFLIKQKKHFEFKGKQVEIGGDICVTGNLRFGNKAKVTRFTMAMNADAMGKSMQGAGGSIVMGVAMNSIMSRSAAKDWVVDKPPEVWLTDVYYEIHRIFKTFNGSMVISCTVMLINDETGEVYYFNAEHPYAVLYRNGRAEFIEDRLNLRKLGLDSEIPFQVFKFELEPGDVIILASDGRDDIDLTPEEPVRTINEDDALFLKHVVAGRGDIEEIYHGVQRSGEFIDDFSILRIGYREVPVHYASPQDEPGIILPKDIDHDDLESVYSECKKLLRDNKDEVARQLLQITYNRSEANQNNPKINKLYGLLSFKARDYISTIEVIRKYLKDDPTYEEFWYYLAMAEKKLGHYNMANEAGERLKEINPNHALNILNLADVNRLMGKKEASIELTKLVLELEPDNTGANRLMQILKNGTI
ncbi:MAG: SpoIIE family protein phosphatase [Leptospiraceae bacterium]|jgi:tetratricopeptide (TPR) repeat protein/HAMP domain-containing protein|nr:SpoIIE family protein phosphatase [Leptospiraceae bacterium]